MRRISASVSIVAGQLVEGHGGVHELAAALAVGLDGARLHGDGAEVDARARGGQVADVVGCTPERSTRHGTSTQQPSGRFVISPVFGTLP